MYNAHPPVLARIVALMSTRTISRFKDIFQAAPLKIDPLETLHVTVARAYDEHHAQKLEKAVDTFSSPQEMRTSFRFKDISYVYDARLQTSKLVGFVDSVHLEQIKDALDPNIRLAVQFIHAAPPLSRANKSFVASVTDTLVFRETTPFELAGLYYLTEEEYRQNFKSHYVGFDKSDISEEI